MSIPSSLVSSIENITSEFTFRYSVYLSNTKKKLLCGSSRKSLTIPNQLSWKSEKAKNWLSNSITQFFWFLSVWLNTYYTNYHSNQSGGKCGLISYFSSIVIETQRSLKFKFWKMSVQDNQSLDNFW